MNAATLIKHLGVGRLLVAAMLVFEQLPIGFHSAEHVPAQALLNASQTDDQALHDDGGRTDCAFCQAAAAPYIAASTTFTSEIVRHVIEHSAHDDPDLVVEAISTGFRARAPPLSL